MKNKLTIVLSVALAVTGLVAIIVPTVIAVTNQTAIFWMNKRIIKLKPTKDFTDLIVPTDTEVEAQAKLDNFVDKGKLFTIWNKNGEQIIHPYIKVNNITFEEDKLMEIFEVVFDLGNLDDNYLIPPFGLRLKWGDSPLIRFSYLHADSVINGIEGVSAASNNTELENALSTAAARATIQSIISYGEKLKIGAITVSTPTAFGYPISVGITPKDNSGLVFVKSQVTYEFKIKVTVSQKLGIIDAIRLIEGVAAAQTVDELSTALNTDAAKNAILGQIVRVPNVAISSIRSVSVADASEARHQHTSKKYNLNIRYEMANGYIQDTKYDSIVIDNFTVASLTA